MTSDLSLYEALEVSPRASAGVIRAAYRCLVQAYHPDKNPDLANATARLAAINHAYAVLSDPEQRNRYDQTRAQPAALAGRTAERRGAVGRPHPTHPGHHSPAQGAGNDKMAARAFAFRPLG